MRLKHDQMMLIVSMCDREIKALTKQPYSEGDSVYDRIGKTNIVYDGFETTLGPTENEVEVGKRQAIKDQFMQLLETFEVEVNIAPKESKEETKTFSSPAYSTESIFKDKK